MAKLVSATYGDALFELALEDGKLDGILKEVEFLKDSLSTNSELSPLLTHPRVSEEEKKALMKDIFGGRLSDITMGFVMIVIEKGRIGDIETILNYFCEKAREYKNIGVAHVTSAVSLSDKQKKSIEDRLLDTTKYVSYEMDYNVDEKLIGGIVIRIGDRVFDSSVKNCIDKMSRELSKIQLG